MAKEKILAIKEMLIKWIKKWFEENGKGCNAIIGISGGKDSTIVAKLCVEALGKDKVIGVLMPDGEQKDYDDSLDVCKYLEIQYMTVNIEEMQLGLLNEFRYDSEFTEQSLINLPARLRMATLYFVSQNYNGRVANTCNLSEDYVGYATRYGDGAGDFSPLANLTVTEVKQLGYELGLTERFIEKIPTDGLCGKTDEENLGFSYEILDKYIRTGEIYDLNIKNKIDFLHKQNAFKLKYMDTFKFIF